MKKNKLRKLLEVFDPHAGTAVDFSQFDAEITKLKESLSQKIQATTIDDVYNQLEKFKKKLDFKGMLETIDNLENSLKEKINEITTSLEESKRVYRELLNQKDDASNNKIAVVVSNIEILENKLVRINNEKSDELIKVKEEINKLLSYDIKNQDALDEIEKKLVKENNDIKGVVETTEKLRKEFNNRLGSLSHGGNANRNILVSGNSSTLSRYTDLNIKPGANVTLTYTNNDNLKTTDLTIAATGGGGSVIGTTRSISTVSVSSVVADTALTDIVIIANAGVQLTMPTAVGNTNLYTIKNTSTSSVLVNTTGGQKIDTSTTLIMPVQFTSVDLISDNSDWQIT